MKNKTLASEQFRVAPGKKVNLKKWSTDTQKLYTSEDDLKEQLADFVKELSNLQTVLYASNSYSVLFIFQAMDAAGKDSAIRRVMSGVNPQGCQVFSFQHPSKTELDHDFLWRTSVCLPERGRIGIFNRSYYEEVLIVKVHKAILEAQKLPGEHKTKEIWEDRFESIRNLESHLHKNGTRVVKFFLHLSKDEQRERFLKRIDNPDKNWKITPADIKERGHWDDYQEAYEECIAATTSKDSPWYIIPADDKASAHILISEVVVQTLRSLDLSFPKVDKKRVKELKEMRKSLKK